MLRGDFAAAAALMEPYLANQPGDFRGWGLLGRCKRLLGELHQAEQAIVRSLQLAPGFAASMRELALLRQAQGRSEEAGAMLQSLLEQQPDQPGLLWELAMLEAESRPEQALPLVQRLRSLRPSDFEPAVLEGQLLLRLGQYASARNAFERLLAVRPDSLPLLDGAFRATAGLEAASIRRRALMQRIVDRAPDPARCLRLAQEHVLLGEFPEAHQAIDHSLTLDPEFLAARWAAFQLPQDVAPVDDAAIEAFKNSWGQGLLGFEALDYTRPAIAAQVLDCVGQSTAFYRHYLGDPVDTEQRRYGALLARMMKPLDPGRGLRPLRGTNRRIGFVSAHLREHTVARLFGPWIESLARSGFDVHVFALEPMSPAWFARLQSAVTLQSGPRPLPEWRDAITASELDVLVYPEVGMDALTQGLAALRLAPVQAALWGHPVSSGLPTLDWFLSPDAMEPASAEQSYSERLLRLPGLGHALQPEQLPAPMPFPLPAAAEDTVELLCAQTAYKLLPGQDFLFGRILAARPQARLHLLADDREPVQARLRDRMSRTLSDCGADPARQLLIHGFVPLPQYLGLAAACSLNLDSIGWSGGMSSLDLLGQGIPTLALPGRTMRSRQTAALLERLGVPELIANDDADYVATALALIDSPPRRDDLRQRILARHDQLFAEPAALQALVQFLSTVQAR
jgi:protein O-GlcNAc transferase